MSSIRMMLTAASQAKRKDLIFDSAGSTTPAAANLWKDQSDKRVVGQTNRPVCSRDQPSLKVPSNRTTAGDNQSLSPDPKAIMEIRPSRF